MPKPATPYEELSAEHKTYVDTQVMIDIAVKHKSQEIELEPKLRGSFYDAFDGEDRQAYVKTRRDTIIKNWTQADSQIAVTNHATDLVNQFAEGTLLSKGLYPELSGAAKNLVDTKVEEMKPAPVLPMPGAEIVLDIQPADQTTVTAQNLPVAQSGLTTANKPDIGYI